jgi:hypothetical protein
MTVEEIKKSLDSLTAAERREVALHLSHLRNAANQAHHDLVTARLDDKDPSHWLTLEEFERRLGEG